MTVDVENLYHVLKTESLVQEKEKARDYDFRQGEIEFQNVSYSHYYVDENPDDYNEGPNV